MTDYYNDQHDFDWGQTCVHDAAWFDQNALQSTSHYRTNSNEPEWWYKDQISIVWDPITLSYLYHNRNTGLTHDSPDKALLEEDLPVLEDYNHCPLIDALLNARFAPDITALYNPLTDTYSYYHNTHTHTHPQPSS